MSKVKNMLILGIKAILIVYLPIIFLFHIIYDLIFKIDMNFSWDKILIYSVVIGISAMFNYVEETIEEEVEDFNGLKDSIIKDRWEIIEKSENSLILKAKFDFPFRLFIDGKVYIDYFEGTTKIKGPAYYIKNIVKDINGKYSIVRDRIGKIVVLTILITAFSMPILKDLDVIWNIQKSFHNTFVKDVEIIEIDSQYIVGNSVQNINNYGLGVENDDYIFYVEDGLNLVRVNKDYQDKTYLIQNSSGTSINGLNIAGNWIFYTSGKNLSRIKTDGTHNKMIYKLGYLFDIHMKDNFLYFINYLDDFNVYKIDINGRNLERVLKVNPSDIALYDNKIIVSHSDNGKDYVESMNLDGSERMIVLETFADDLVKWDGYYYFIGEGRKLYRNKDDGIIDPELLIDGEVSSYIITDTGIFYSLHSEDIGYPGKGVLKVDLNGTGNTLIFETENVEGFTKLGDFIIFSSWDDSFKSGIRKLNIFTNDIEIIK